MVSSLGSALPESTPQDVAWQSLMMGALLRTTGVFPLPRLKLDRSLARDPVSTAGYGILVERGASP